jgi:hypothetical protein
MPRAVPSTSHTTWATSSSSGRPSATLTCLLGNISTACWCRADWFLFRYQPAQSLAPLRSLTPATIASLTNLRVILNEGSCHAVENGTEGCGGCCHSRRQYGLHCCDDMESECCQANRASRNWYCENIHQYEKRLHNRPLRGADPSAKAMLTEWKATAAHLAAHATPGQLELSLVCDVDDGEADFASQVVDALRLFPQLKDSHVRLSMTPNGRLRELAQDAALKARGILPRSSPSDSTASPPPFPLLSLPLELRLRILEYTDLITPLKEVIWSRGHGKYLATRPYCPFWDSRSGHKSLRSIHHGCQFDSCSMRPYAQQSIGCFCRRDHAAFSSTCRCWAPPTDLFLVCRLLRDDANLVFFSSNRFVVIDGPTMCLFGPPYPGEYESNRLAASRFLRDIVPAGCHGHLRFVELVFPPWAPGSWPQDEQHPTLQDWSDTIDWVKDKINAPALTMRMVATFRADGGHAGYPAEITEDEAEEIMETYLRILRPLARLGGTGGLAAFSAKLSWPWRRLASALNVRDEERETLEEILRASERSLRSRAECLVLAGPRTDVFVPEDSRPRPTRGAWEYVYVLDY